MTRKEWIEKNLPAYINRNAGGGVIGCPRTYRELARIDPSVLMSCKKNNGITCTECWNTELNVKEERKKNMTRREFVIQNYGKEVADINIACGIHGCPGHYPKLVALDPSCNASCVGQPSCKDNGLTCTECWNVPLPNVKIRKTMGEPHIKDVFYTIVRYPIGKYWLYLVGEFSIISMSAINDTMVKCISFDYDFQYEYTFFYNLIDKVVSLTPDMQYQAKSTPNLDRSLFLERRDAIEALEKWTGNVVDKSYYFLKQKGE